MTIPRPARKTAILLGLIVLLAGTAFAAENVTELKIDSIATPVQSGGSLHFSFSAGNMAGPPCSAQIEYWFGKESEKSVQGSDNFYLEEGQTVSESASLIIPSEMQGVKTFYLEMQCNDSSILASRVIEISTGFPTMPQFDNILIDKSEEGEQLQFSYTINSNREDKVAIHIEESIIQDNNLVWTGSQNIAVSGSSSIKRFGPVLEPGKYTLVVNASSGGETAEIVRGFTVSPTTMPIIPMATAIMAVLGLLLFAGMAVTARYITTKRGYGRQEILVTAPTEAKPAGKQKLQPSKEMICLVESESSGILDEKELGEVLDTANIGSGKKALAMEFASKTPVKQAIKSCIAIDKQKRVQFETTVEINVANNSNRNWSDLVIVARLPMFLGEHISGISADTKLQAVKKRHAVMFAIEKLNAMRSTSISYKVPKLVSQEEANTVPLPAVMGYEESEPLVITKVQKQEDEEKAKSFYAKIEAEEKRKKTRRKKGRKKGSRQAA